MHLMLDTSRCLPLLLAVLVALAPCRALPTEVENQAQGLPGIFEVEVTGQRVCAPTESIRTDGLNLTEAEKQLLPSICWQPELAAQHKQMRLRGTSGRGVPPGVSCKVMQW